MNDVHAEREQFLGQEKGVFKSTSHEDQEPSSSAQRRRYYVPVELSTSFLVLYCIIILVVFTLLQLAAAAFYHLPPSDLLAQVGRTNTSLPAHYSARKPLSSKTSTPTASHATITQLFSFVSIEAPPISVAVSSLAEITSAPSSVVAPKRQSEEFAQLAARNGTQSASSSSSSFQPFSPAALTSSASSLPQQSGGAPNPGSWTNPNDHSNSLSARPPSPSGNTAPPSGSWTDPISSSIP